MVDGIDSIDSIDHVGQQLGNYRLEKLVGQGGFAHVYLGEHIYLKTPAAIKVVQKKLTQEALEQFLTEARTVVRLAHPNIIRVLEFGIENATPFLVMSYAPYGSLRQRHARSSMLPTTGIISYVNQIALALQYAHDRNVIHRDIKPENMLLGDNHVLMLSDFGVAIRAHSMQSAPTHSMHYVDDIAGTTAYMAPELFDGKPCRASDQYALGAVVYEWFCGVPPFQGTETEIVLQHLQVAPPSLRERLPGLAPSIEQVIMKALNKDPHRRYTNMREFANALRDACVSVPLMVAASPFSTDTPVRRVTASLLPHEHSSVTVVDFYKSKSIARAIAPSVKNTPPVQEHRQARRIFSRRKVMACGLAGIGVAALGFWGIKQTIFQVPLSREIALMHPTTSLTKAPDILKTMINTTNTRPALASWQTQHLDMFVRGYDNALWHRGYDGQWSAWESLSGLLSFDATVTSWGAGRLDVFARGLDNTLQHRYYDGVWHDWESLGGVLSSDPAVASWGAGRLDVFARGANNDLIHKYYDGVWHEWQSLGGLISSSPTVAAWSAGRLDVFARGLDNGLWHRAFDGTWHEWDALGGELASDPAVASWGAGRLDVFVRGAGSDLIHKYYDGAWHEWVSLGGVLTSSPAAVSWGSNRIDIYARSVNNVLQHLFYDGAWRGWEVVT